METYNWIKENEEMSHRYSIEDIRQRTAMSQKISAKDHSYGIYAGALFSDAETLAIFKALDDTKLLEQPFSSQNLFTFYKTFLNERRKAYFASAGSTEITKLGFILGWTVQNVTAKDTRKQLDQLSKASISKTD